MGNVDLETYEDEAGHLWIKGLIPHEALGGFLNADLQRSDALMERLRQWLGPPEAEPTAPWRGNAHEVSVSGQTVTITCVYAAPNERQGRCTLSRSDFEAVLDAWQRIYQAHPGDKP